MPKSAWPLETPHRIALQGVHPVAAHPVKTRDIIMNTIVVCSGGLDSVTLAHHVAQRHGLAALVSFDYGQRHRRELDCAAAAAARLGVPHHLIDITAIGAHLTGSALTDAIDVPDGHYAEETMKTTVVPNRNAIMLSIAFGLAAAGKLDAVAVAVHGGDHFIYPDCRPGFIRSFEEMQAQALDGYANVRLYAPYVEGTKAEIVADGAGNGTDFAATWSCYKGGERHCGRCGTCVERREAFHLAGIHDPTDYADGDFWKDAIAQRPG
jgi:7-cyano-7-deazaguanine synthase